MEVSGKRGGDPDKLGEEAPARMAGRPGELWQGWEQSPHKAWPYNRLHVEAAPTAARPFLHFYIFTFLHFCFPSFCFLFGCFVLLCTGL